MVASPELEVTLSPDLYTQLRIEARRLGVPMSYLVASVVLDTIEECETADGAADPDEVCLEPALAAC